MIRVETPETLKGSARRKVEFFTGVDDQLPDISYFHGYEGVTIRSHEPSWGSVPIQGRDRLKTLRDGLIDACNHFGID